MARGRGDEEGRWKEAMGAGVLLTAASLGPWIYCGATTEAVEGASVAAMCLEAHPLQFPTMILAAGIMLMLVGSVVRVREESERKDVERERKRLDRAVERAGQRQGMRNPQMSAKSMQEAGGETPEYIEVDDYIDDDDHEEEEQAELPEAGEEESLMGFLEAEANRRQSQEGKALVEAGYYVPGGLEGAAVFYLDGSAKGWRGADEERVGDEAKAFTGVEEALQVALNWVLEHQQAVMIRVKPGVYQGRMTIPSGVTVINHELPANMNVDQRLQWLQAQEDVDHRQRVTFLTPGDEELAIRCPKGEHQGLFGCYVAGRRGVAQRGMEAEEAQAMAIVNCAFEGFRKGALNLKRCGENLPGQSTQVVGCIFRDNRHQGDGGAVSIEGGVVRLAGSIFEGNRAPRGGAVAAKNCEKPLDIKRCLFRRNRAMEVAKNQGDVDPWEVKPGGWGGRSGLGGALYVGGGLARVVDSIFEGNDAAMGGGAVAAVGARVVMKGSARSRCSVQGNRGKIGGGALAVGWGKREAMIKAEGGEWVRNLATTMGGAAAAVGRAMIRFKEVAVELNRAGRPQLKAARGGALAVMGGARLVVDGGKIEGNKATGDGGAVIVEQGSLKLDGVVQVMKNEASGGMGGAVAVLMEGRRGLDDWLREPGIEAPWKVDLASARLGQNRAKEVGGGVYVGHRSGDVAMSLDVVIARRDWLVDNVSDEGPEHGQNLWVHWREELRASDEQRRRLELELR